jgi:hypothetical protein
MVVIVRGDRGWCGGQRRHQVADECRFKRANNGLRLTMNQTSKEAADGLKSKSGRQQVKADNEPNFKKTQQWVMADKGQSIKKGRLWPKLKRK